MATFLGFVMLVPLTHLPGTPSAAPAPLDWTSIRVLDGDGAPLAAAIWHAGSATDTSAGGDARLKLPQPAWVSVSAPGHRAQTVLVQDAATVILSQEPVIRLAFAGDALFGRRLYDAADEPTKRLWMSDGRNVDPADVWKHVEPLIASADLALVNLEGAVAEGTAWLPWMGKGFRMPPSFLDATAQAGFDVATVANNHALDRGPGGAARMLELLAASRLQHVGLGNASQPDVPLVRTVGGASFAVVGCTMAVPQVDAYWAADARPTICRTPAFRAMVQDAADAGHVTIVFAHAGGRLSQGVDPPAHAIRNESYEDGAALVVFAGSHVAGGFEMDAGRLTAWNLGNSVFDQRIWETYPSGILFVDFVDGAVARAFWEPVWIDEFLPVAVAGPVGDAVLARLMGAPKQTGTDPRVAAAAHGDLILAGSFEPSLIGRPVGVAGAAAGGARPEGGELRMKAWGLLPARFQWPEPLRIDGDSLLLEMASRGDGVVVRAQWLATSDPGSSWRTQPNGAFAVSEASCPAFRETRPCMIAFDPPEGTGAVRLAFELEAGPWPWSTREAALDDITLRIVPR